MPIIAIHVPIPDDMQEFFLSRDMIVAPLNDHEAQQMAVALSALADVAATNRKALSTLQQFLDTKGADPVHIAKTLEMLMEPNRLAVEQIEFVRVLLGRSARVGRTGPDEGETIQ